MRMITHPADIQMVLGFSIKTSSKMRTETGCQIWQLRDLDVVTGSHIVGSEAADARLQRSERKGTVGNCKRNAGPVCSPRRTALHRQEELLATFSCCNKIKRILANIFNISTSNFRSVLFFSVSLSWRGFSYSQGWP